MKVMSGARTAGPAFFNETINCEIYTHVILGQFFPELTEGGGGGGRGGGGGVEEEKEKEEELYG
jgi:hypothetical protein